MHQGKNLMYTQTYHCFNPRDIIQLILVSYTVKTGKMLVRNKWDVFCIMSLENAWCTYGFTVHWESKALWISSLQDGNHFSKTMWLKI